MTAIFEKKRVHGSIRYYPKDKNALLLVALKRAVVTKYLKKRIKCLAERELKIATKLGFSVTIIVHKSVGTKNNLA